MSTQTTIEQTAAVAGIGTGFEWMLTVLFKPFRFVKWFMLALAVLLAGLDGWGLRLPRMVFQLSDDKTQWGGQFHRFQSLLHHWYAAGPVLFVAFVSCAALAALAVWVVFQWLSCYGIFLFTAGVARNEMPFGRLWREVGTASRQLFVFRTLFTLLLGICGTLVALAAAVAVSGTRSSWVIKAAFVTVAVCVVAALLFAYIVMRFVLNDVVVPVMLKFDLRIVDALVFAWELIAVRAGQFLLFVVLKLVLALVGSVVVFVALVFCTCCVGLLPLVHQFLTLPLTVFLRGYTLRFLEGIHPDLKLIADREPA